MTRKTLALLTLILSVTTSNAQQRPGAPAFKILTENNKGFKVVDCSRQRVLAYSNTACDTTNPGLRWWLKSIEQMPASEITKRNIPPTNLGFPSKCEPLIETEWGQESPYNWMCPETNYAPWGGFLPEAEHCPVGCVATATAQIMNYHKYPAHGQGECSINLENQVYTVNLSQAKYRWDLMLKNYSVQEYNDEQAMAVAELCYHVGVASQMGYRPEASATANYNALVALKEHFDYDVNPNNIVERSQYSDQQWMRLVYTELSEGRPILYEGVGIDMDTYDIYGHSFIIDGYDADGLVHVNWGWNGKTNGFYDIALLNPSNLQFDVYQMMALGIKPKLVPGDVNGDGECTSSDVTALYNLILYNDDSKIVNGDQNGDGEITSSDVTAVYNIILGL